MKKYLVKFTSQLLINDSINGELNFKCVYGFLAPYDTDNDEKNKETRKNIPNYVKYLCTLHELSNNNTAFNSINSFSNWIDKNCLEWSNKIGENIRRKLGIDYNVYEIELDELSGCCLSCCIDDGLICCKEIIDSLTNTADGHEGPVNVLLYNRPIWLPREVLWPGEEGFIHIYGVTTPDETNDRIIAIANQYLGYLAMCEEYGLNKITPSGYKAGENDDLSYWIRDGKEYFLCSTEVIEESLLCLEKNCLRVSDVVTQVPYEDIKAGIKGSFVISQNLYESLLSIDHSGCPMYPYDKNEE